MAYVMKQIAETLKAARARQGLSQRALAKLAGVPQSHISKIERGAVDLRFSSLAEIARVLELEVMLIPQSSLPAVQSIVRATERPSPDRATDTSSVRELEKLQESLRVSLREHPTLKELAQLQRQVKDMQRLNIPLPDLAALRETLKSLDVSAATAASTAELRNVLSHLQELRNRFAHEPHVERAPRPAYSLDENGDA